MNNNYGFLYNLVVLPFAAIFGNTLAVHRSISILCVIISGALIALTLMRVKTSSPFAFAGGSLVTACLLFNVTPLARPDALGEFLFLAAILLPWRRNFDRQSLIPSALAGICAFLAKPYFLLSIIIVATYIFVFVSKGRGLYYLLVAMLSLVVVLYITNSLFECYFLGAILSNAGNSILSDSHMWEQLTRFIKIFLPCLILLFLGSKTFIKRSHIMITEIFKKPGALDFIHPSQPLYRYAANYFEFFLLSSTVVVAALLGKHIGAYMTYFFQLIAPGLILSLFQRRNLLQERAALAAPLILSNLLIICFGVLYPNKLSLSQQRDWEGLYKFVADSDRILNSPILVAEMARLGRTPVDSGQSEYYFTTRSYSSNPFAPDYEKIVDQGNKYLKTNQSAIQNQEYDYIFIVLEAGPSPFIDSQFIDRRYDTIETIKVVMPQSGQECTVEVKAPKK